MERFAGWLRRQGARQVPTSFVVLGIVGTLVPGELMLIGLVPVGPPTILAAVGLAVASWTPMALRRYGTRHQLRLDPKGFASSVAHWRSKLEPHAETLEAAAIDLEQIESLADKTALDPAQAKALARSAHARLWRMFELTVAAPARHRLTLDGAETCIEGDARWIAEARRLVERTLETPEPSESGDPLTELRTLADAHEAALVELRA